MRKKHWFTLAAFTWLVISTILLTLPGKDIPSDNWLVKFLEKIWFDKWVHVGMFAIMAFLLCISWKFNREDLNSTQLRKHFIIIGLIALGYGILMEFVQRYMIADRSFDILDIIADGLGAVTGAAFSTWRYIKK